jgi:hypothetical protein
MVILDLMRVMGGLANGALAEVTIRSAPSMTADRWCARKEYPRRADIDDWRRYAPGPSRRPPDPPELGRDRMPGARPWLYTNFH